MTLLEQAANLKPLEMPANLADRVFPYKANFRSLWGMCRKADCFRMPCYCPGHKRYPRPKYKLDPLTEN